MVPTKISYFHIRVPTWIFHVFRTKWFHSKTCKTSLIHLKAEFSQFFEYFLKNTFCLRLRKGTCGVTNALIAVKNTCKNENFEDLNILVLVSFVQKWVKFIVFLSKIWFYKISNVQNRGCKFLLFVSCTEFIC